jgi:hypothetical protein
MGTDGPLGPMGPIQAYYATPRSHGTATGPYNDSSRPTSQTAPAPPRDLTLQTMWLRTGRLLLLLPALAASYHASWDTNRVRSPRSTARPRER